MDEPRNGVYKAYVFFFYKILQNLLISNLLGAKMASLGNFRY